MICVVEQMPRSISDVYIYFVILVLKILFVPEKQTNKIFFLVVDEPKASVSIVARPLHLNPTDSPLNLYSNYLLFLESRVFPLKRS